MGKGIRQRFDVLVVGAGPAGLAAACGAAECGVGVRIVEDSASLGGPMWRAESPDGLTTDATSWDECPPRRKRDDAWWDTRLSPTRSGCPAGRVNRRPPRTELPGKEEIFSVPDGFGPNGIGAGGLEAMVKSGLPFCSPNSCRTGESVRCRRQIA